MTEPNKAGKVRLTSNTRRGFYWVWRETVDRSLPAKQAEIREMEQAFAWLRQNMLRPVAKGDAADQQSTNGDTQG